MKQATLARGKTFDCRACHKRLRTSSPNKLAAAGVFVIAWVAQNSIGFLPVMIILLAGFLIELMTIRVTLVE